MSKIKQDVIEFILEKMFTMVNRSYDPEVLKEKEWYLQTQWSKETQSEFTQWLISFLRKRYHLTKRIATNEAAWFVLNCGWRTKIDREEETTKQKEESQAST